MKYLLGYISYLQGCNIHHANIHKPMSKKKHAGKINGTVNVSLTLCYSSKSCVQCRYALWLNTPCSSQLYVCWFVNQMGRSKLYSCNFYLHHRRGGASTVKIITFHSRPSITTAISLHSAANVEEKNVYVGTCSIHYVVVSYMRVGVSPKEGVNYIRATSICITGGASTVKIMRFHSRQSLTAAISLHSAARQPLTATSLPTNKTRSCYNWPPQWRYKSIG